MAVTADLSIRFLHPAAGGDVVGRCTLLKITDRLACGEVRLSMAQRPELLVANATGSYVLPKGSTRGIR